jgi:NAD(P)-dependent dehydrogenase (short-subunit alcohol dehydrogenase family)
VLVNNAFALGETKAFLDADLDSDWRAPFEVNLFGTLRLSQQVARHMSIAGSGSIVMISTLSVRTPIITAEFAAYAASKGALRTAARYLAQELGPLGIRVNSVTPGQILGDALLKYLDRKAEQQGKTGEDLRATIEAKLPLRHLVGSDEIADAVVFFASDLSRAITGTELDVNGGEYIPG